LSSQGFFISIFPTGILIFSYLLIHIFYRIKKTHRSFDSFSRIFTKEDRDEFPEIFKFPKGMYEVSMTKPLGIVFEEIEIGDGVFVQELVEGGLADVQGKIQPGDVLVGVTAIKVVGGKIIYNELW
jgi:C-terminal processing protease CtpA/Prc